MIRDIKEVCQILNIPYQTALGWNARGSDDYRKRMIDGFRILSDNQISIFNQNDKITDDKNIKDICIMLDIPYQTALSWNARRSSDYRKRIIEGLRVADERTIETFKKS
ncbi:Uncharacterised protein [Campylobacter hyointestinalis]|uniref:Uncharacterized protein n=1 Tax=Campylobacter hyointestinalis subsp. hyointestinalis TaxID=91352 RepID=A0A9W5ESW1_CAMHY|nr:hypothetical protein [Campylobacter hyointestinalis]TWO22959.1 hypothetical protein YZ80_01585 [Campylobacter hyointestinalis]CUU74862.1 Uncharacterised protein [Campylobacter hyointestinalis subsp. hyointestinalis]CUU76218.1 Uncharacterised protein [Campylobacter hyointestinalis]CUU78823.1 Uncharacterised protein [Campylobacter hyointestinalis subsp. hyointestinalis]